MVIIEYEGQLAKSWSLSEHQKERNILLFWTMSGYTKVCDKMPIFQQSINLFPKSNLPFFSFWCVCLKFYCMYTVHCTVQYSMVFSSRSWRVCAIMTWLAWALLSLLMRRSCAASLALASSSSLAWTSLRDCWYFLMDFCARDRYSWLLFLSRSVREKPLVTQHIL